MVALAVLRHRAAVRAARACAEPIRRVRLAGIRGLGPGDRHRGLPAAARFLLSPRELLFQWSCSSWCYLFLHLEYAGMAFLVTSGCSLAKRSLVAEISLSFRRRSPSAVHILPVFNTAAGAWLLGATTASGQCLRWQKVAQAESPAVEHSQRFGRERRRRLGGFPRP